MTEIEYTNIVQLQPVRTRTWKIYAQKPADNEEPCKFFADEIECWALVENVRECQEWESPTLYVGRTPCVRETVIRGLCVDDMNVYDTDGSNFLGCTQTDPREEITRWNDAADKYFASREMDQVKS